MLLKRYPKLENKNLSKVVNFNIEIELGKLKSIKDSATIAMSTDSTGVYKLGKDVEKYCGIPEADIIRDVKAGKDRPEDAIIYGLTNIMDNGKNIYLWVNGTRLQGMSKKVGTWPAIIEILSHESTHLAKLLLTRAIAKSKGININGPEWITYDFGAGEYNWPAVGDMNDKNKLIQIDDENFASVIGYTTQQILPHFLEMAKQFLPDLK
jgi:hypothetical protein